MRIAFISNEYATESSFTGGLAQYARRTAEALVAFGHHVEVFVWSDRDQTLEHNGVTVHRVSGILGPWFRIGTRLSRGAMRQPAFILAMNERVRQRFLSVHRTEPFDIIQSHSVWAPTVTALRQTRVPVVTRVSSYQPLWSEAYRRKRSFQLWCRERLEVMQMRSSDAVYAPSRLVAKAIQDCEGLAVEVIEPPVYLEEALTDPSLALRLRRKGKYILFVGTLGRMKGADVLAKSLCRVFHQEREVHAVFAGADLGLDGKPAWPQIQETLGAGARRAVYLGKVPHGQLYPVIANAAVVALPSRIDNLPNACLEAMALGAVVVGTRGASFDEVITHGRNGFLVPREDDAALARALFHVLQLPSETRRQIGSAARSTLRHMTPERSIPRLVDYYGRVMEHGSQCASRS